MKRIKKSIIAVLVAFLTLLILVTIEKYCCEEYKYENIVSFDPTECHLTYAMQTILVKSHTKNWTLSSVSEYNAAGELQWERMYFLDSEGNSYYMNGDKQQFVSRFPRKGFSDITNYLSEFQLSEERHDIYDRIVLREGIHPSISEHIECAEFYYAPNTTSDAPSALSVFVRTISSKSTDGIEPVCYGENNEPLMEYNTYEITNYDRYGNEICIVADGACFLKTDTNGYLEAIIEEESGTYRVISVDDSGKPLWIAVYSKNTLGLISYILYQYKTI